MIWAIYGSILAVLYVGLSIRTLRLRRHLRIPVGDGGNATLLRAIRAHGNCSEYVPLGLLLLLGCEQLGAPTLLIHALGTLLVLGRLVHSLGVSKEPEPYALRVTGMALTFTCYLVSATFILWQGVVGGA